MATSTALPPLPPPAAVPRPPQPDARPNSFYAPQPVAPSPLAIGMPAAAPRPPFSPHSSPGSSATTLPSSLGHRDDSPPALLPAKQRGRAPRPSLAIPAQPPLSPARTPVLSPSRSFDRSAASSIVGSRPTTPSLPVSPSIMFNQGRMLLQPGDQAARMSHEKTLALYRQNAAKLQDPNLMYELAVIMVETADTTSEPHEHSDLIKDALALLRKISDRGHAEAQYFLADCYARGLVTGKPQYDKAVPLYILASKHGHGQAAFRAGQLTEEGNGVMQSSSKAVRLYRKAAAEGHPGAMFRLGTAELNGELGLSKNAKGGVKWIKLAAELATPEFPRAAHEFALLHQRGIENVVFQDDAYACELLAQAAELGYAPSAYKLGVNYEYGKMGCAPDAGLSIHMYNIAAQQNHKEACFALCAWYLVGAQGILPQSDTEAYLWAKKAAEQGLAQAEFTVGYFSEQGIGAKKDAAVAKAWYARALEHGDKRASVRLQSLGGVSAAHLAPPAATETHTATMGGKTYTVHTVQSYRNPSLGATNPDRARSRSHSPLGKRSWLRA